MTDLKLIITSIEAQKRPHRFNLYLNQTFAFGISEDTLISFQLHKGQTISQKILEQIRNDEQINQAYQASLNYLTYRMRSSAEVKKKLRSKDYPDDIISATISKLKQQNLLNDYQFALAYLKTMQRTASKGPYEIKKKLQEKRIPPELIEKAFNEYDLQNEQELLVKLVEKYLTHYQNCSFKEKITKTKQRLMIKGFTSTSIDAALVKISPDEDPEQETQVLQKLLSKIWQRYNSLPVAKRKQKAKQFLFRKGFPLEKIDQALIEMTEN